MEERLCCDCEYSEEPCYGEHCKKCEKTYEFRWEPVEMEERTCDNCRHYGKKRDESPCKNCSNCYASMWKQAQEPAEQKEKRCFTCRYENLFDEESPCKECIELGDGYRYWEPQEAEDEEKKEEKGKKEIELKKRPEMLAFPVPIYERTDSKIPEKVRISFTNGTSAIYVLHVDQPKPLVMESIRIIRKWRSEGYQYVPPRRRRTRK